MLHLSFDIGHSSIGWAVLDKDNPKGCGAVTFKADDCQNHARAGFRRMRRNIAARRNRIRRLEALLLHAGVMQPGDFAETRKNPDKWPWLKAAKVLSGDQKKPLTWPELWGVLRWYAHNRGYDGNALWSGIPTSADDDDTEKVQNARHLMDEFGTGTMAETLCAFLDVNPATDEQPLISSYFKGQNAAFPRETVKAEVRRIFKFHLGKLKGCDEKLMETLCGDAHESWKTVECSDIRLPKRFHGGLLFGQMIPRFDNRIIPTCRISGKKTPHKDCPAFYRYRWGMLMANMRVERGIESEPSSLSKTERQQLHDAMEASGSLNKTSLKKAFKEMGLIPTNIDSLFMIPEFEKALVFDPAKVLLHSERIKPLWDVTPEKFQKVFVGRLLKGRPCSLALWRETLAEELTDLSHIDQALEKAYQSYAKRLKKKAKPYDTFLAMPLEPGRASGRAPYSTELMNRAWEEIMEGKDPKASGGCLEETEAVIVNQLKRDIDDQTNNHLVRHRLTIFKKLLVDLIDEFAEGDVAEIGNITIEVVRDLQEFSAKTQKQIKQLLGLKLAHHRKIAKYLEEELPKLAGNHPITAGLIKKARIADELGWTCPFTGKKYCLADIVEGRVDREHIIPRSWRPSDSMSSLVLTFNEVNRFKGQRIAWKFVEEEQNKKVPGAPHLQIQTIKKYEAFIKGLRPKSDPRNNPNAVFIDDDRRRWNRKQLLLLPRFDVRKRKENDERFVDGSLTQTSYINKLAAQQAQALFRERTDDEASLWDGPQIVPLAGSVTGAVRKRWKLLGCLSQVCPETRDKVKTEVRDITHLHHALDAITIGLASWYFPNNGRLWDLMSRRAIKDERDQALFRKLLKGRTEVSFTERGQWDISDLPASLKNKIIARLAERRVVQHQPRTMRGLKVQLNTWRVHGIDPNDDSKIRLTQAKRGDDGKRHRSFDSQKRTKLLGLEPKSGVLIREGKRRTKSYERVSKLKDLKGALVIGENYGVALVEPEPVVISYFDVWDRIEALKAENGGKRPIVIQNGSLIEIPKQEGPKPYKYEGRWRVRSIKDTAQGIMLQLSAPDAVGGLTGNIFLKTLIKNGMKVLHLNLTGKIKE